MARDYLIFDDALRDRSLRPLFDRAIEQVDDGSAQVRKLSRGSGFVVDGRGILGTAVLEYAIGLVPADEFDDGAARALTGRMRALFGWQTISYTLQCWVERRLRDPFFENRGSDWEQDWQLLPGADADASALPPSFFRYACYIAIGELKHGPSYASVGANRIFDWVTKLGSELPAQLKKHGTGELPVGLARFRGGDRDGGVTATANDALAVIRIALPEEGEAGYAAILDYLAALFETTDFPRSFAIEFRGPTKRYLPIAGLPKKGVHRFFACAAEYPSLRPGIERYARAVMSEFEWYGNLEDEHCAMPGTFAVFALGLASTAYAPLVLDYLREVDGEHQSMQARFVEAYLDAHGFTAEGVAYLATCAGNIQHLRHRKAYPSMISNRESLEALLALREAPGSAVPGISALRANLSGTPVEDYAWRHALYVIWGDAAEQRDAQGRVGAKVIDGAPDELRPLYEGVFA